MAALKVKMSLPNEVWCTFVLDMPILVPTGLYVSEGHALKNCAPHEGIAALPLGDRFPMFMNELKKAYAPHSGVKWEETLGFLVQKRAKNIIDEFFELAKK